MATITSRELGRSPSLAFVEYTDPEGDLLITLSCVQKGPNGKPWVTLLFPGVTMAQYTALVNAASPYQHFEDFFWGKRPSFPVPLRV